MIVVAIRDFFRNKVFFDIAKILYVDNYTYYDIRICTIFLHGVDVANKTEAFFSSSRVSN